MEIAKNILKVLGGTGRMKVMTGARNFVALKNGVTFRIPKMSGVKGNFVKITLSSLDLYDLEVGNIRKKKGIPTYKVKSEVTGIYADTLMEVLEGETGMYFSL